MNCADINRILDTRSEEFLSRPGVTGVGVGWRVTTHEVLCFIVTVMNADVEIELPQAVEGLPVLKEVNDVIQD